MSNVKVASLFKAGKGWCVYLHLPTGTLPSLANWTGFRTKADAKAKCKAEGYKVWN